MVFNTDIALKKRYAIQSWKQRYIVRRFRGNVKKIILSEKRKNRCITIFLSI